METKKKTPRGFSLIEMVVAIVAVSVLAFAFIPMFTVAMKGGVSMQQVAVMESIAASTLDHVMSGKFSTTCLSSESTTIDVATYTAAVSCSTITGGRHVTVSVSCSGCSSNVSLISIAGDAYDIW